MSSFERRLEAAECATSGRIDIRIIPADVPPDQRNAWCAQDRARAAGWSGRTVHVFTGVLRHRDAR